MCGARVVDDLARPRPLYKLEHQLSVTLSAILLLPLHATRGGLRLQRLEVEGLRVEETALHEGLVHGAAAHLGGCSMYQEWVMLS